MNVLTEQYQGIKSAREALLTYCERITLPDLFKPLATYNQTSIADLLIHVANVYINWINNFEKPDSLPLHGPSEAKTLDDIRKIYQQIDAHVSSFLARHQNDLALLITRDLSEVRTVSATPLELFTHVITHEFHHKGQILNMSRQLGHTPVDTDLIRF
jgi:uncharacterized damage-inducible protein DinB